MYPQILVYVMGSETNPIYPICSVLLENPSVFIDISPATIMTKIFASHNEHKTKLNVNGNKVWY